MQQPPTLNNVTANSDRRRARRCWGHHTYPRPYADQHSNGLTYLLPTTPTSPLPPHPSPPAVELDTSAPPPLSHPPRRHYATVLYVCTEPCSTSQHQRRCIVFDETRTRAQNPERRHIAGTVSQRLPAPACVDENGLACPARPHFPLAVAPSSAHPSLSGRVSMRYIAHCAHMSSASQTIYESTCQEARTAGRGARTVFKDAANGAGWEHC